jgi:hypothetical protein
MYTYKYIHLYTDKDYEMAFRDEQARSVVEARTQKYISKVTSDNLDIIDPTGRASLVDIQPSHITVCLHIYVYVDITNVCIYVNLGLFWLIFNLHILRYIYTYLYIYTVLMYVCKSQKSPVIRSL